MVVDDAAVTPAYAMGFTPDRELPIIWKIAKGSLRNKLLFLLPGALLLSAFAPWAVTPLLMMGGAYLCFEATEKYVNVVTPTGEALVRMSLRELMARIDSTDFIQVHRSGLVNTAAILSATRDEIGHYSLAVRGLQRPLKVSRAFGHLFRPM